MNARVGVLACAVTFTVRWPDGGTSSGWTVPAGTPVWVALGADGEGSAVRVYALDQRRAFADVPTGWVGEIDVISEHVPF